MSFGGVGYYNNTTSKDSQKERQSHSFYPYLRDNVNVSRHARGQVRDSRGQPGVTVISPTMKNEEGSTCNFPLQRAQISDEMVQPSNIEPLNFNMRTPVLPGLPFHSDMLPVSSQNRASKRQPEAHEDYQFYQKLGIEFGNSSSHLNFFGGYAEPMSSCERNIKKGGENASNSYSRDFHEESFTNPNLLSILQSKDQQQIQQQQYGSLQSAEPVPFGPPTLNIMAN